MPFEKQDTSENQYKVDPKSNPCKSGNIWNPDFEDWIWNGPHHSKIGVFKICTFLSRFWIVFDKMASNNSDFDFFDKMASICPYFERASFWIVRLSGFQIPLKILIFNHSKSTCVLISDPFCFVSSLYFSFSGKPPIVWLDFHAQSSLVFPVRINGLLPFRIHENVSIRKRKQHI